MEDVKKIYQIAVKSNLHACVTEYGGSTIHVQFREAHELGSEILVKENGYFLSKHDFGVLVDGLIAAYNDYCEEEEDEEDEEEDEEEEGE